MRPKKRELFEKPTPEIVKSVTIRIASGVSKCCLGQGLL